jgi:sugar lactone lactonase YvrE
MRRPFRWFGIGALLLCLGCGLWAGASEIDEQLMAKRRVFSGIGAGLRAVRHSANGNYYVLASPAAGVALFDAQLKRISMFGAPPEVPAGEKAPRAAIGFGEDCDVDAKGNVYVADRGYNRITEFSSDGKQLKSFAVSSPTSVALLPDGEVAVTSLEQRSLVAVYGENGRLAREFGEPESLSTRVELDRYLNLGRVNSDPQGRVYFGFTYLPEPTVRQFDRGGYVAQTFEFTGVDAFPEAQSVRKEIDRQETRKEPPFLRPILTAFGVDPVNGDVWMALHNTLVHFDKDGIRRSEYQIYTPSGTRLEASVILVEEERLLIGADPLGVYEFPRPDRRH